MLKPATSDRNWDLPLNANADFLDGVNAIGALIVTTTETPSSALTVRVASGSFLASTGLFVGYAGTSSQALTLSATNYVYLTDAGTLTVNTTGFPSSSLHVPLAVAVTGASTVTSITDARKPFASAGGPATAGAAQAAVGALTAVALTDSSGGTASTTLASISDGPTANAVASLAAQLNHAVADLAALRALVNALQSAAVATRQIKGSA